MMRVLVAGISGVGKTRACEWISQRNRDFHHLSVSGLIEKQSDSFQDKRVLSTASQQKKLCNSIRKNCEELGDGITLIDGHLVLWDHGRRFYVPPEAVQSLGLSLILLVDLNYTQHLLADSVRRSREEFLQTYRMNHQERIAAMNISSRLRLRLEYTSSNPHEIKKSLK